MKYLKVTLILSFLFTFSTNGWAPRDQEDRTRAPAVKAIRVEQRQEPGKGSIIGPFVTGTVGVILRENEVLFSPNDESWGVKLFNIFPTVAFTHSAISLAEKMSRPIFNQFQRLRLGEQMDYDIVRSYSLVSLAAGFISLIGANATDSWELYLPLASFGLITTTIGGAGDIASEANVVNEWVREFTKNPRRMLAQREKRWQFFKSSLKSLAVGGLLWTFSGAMPLIVTIPVKTYAGAKLLRGFFGGISSLGMHMADFAASLAR